MKRKKQKAAQPPKVTYKAIRRAEAAMLKAFDAAGLSKTDSLLIMYTQMAGVVHTLRKGGETE